MQLLQRLLDIQFDRKKPEIIYLFFRFKIYKINAASYNELKLLGGKGSFCQGWRIREGLNYFQISFHPFFKTKEVVL